MREFKVGQTVFLTKERMPGDVVAVTTDGRYVVDMGDTGVLDLFSDQDLETYDAERWHG